MGSAVRLCLSHTAEFAFDSEKCIPGASPDGISEVQKDFGAAHLFESLSWAGTSPPSCPRGRQVPAQPGVALSSLV